MAFLAMKIFILLMLTELSFADQCPTFTPKVNFNINKYTGFWYEVARIPSIFQPNTKCDNATYTLNSDRTVAVFNQATSPQGQYVSIRGVATIIDPNIPASFRLVFEAGQEGAYNVLETDYKHYAAVYSCRFIPIIGANVEFGYILSRNKKLQESKLRKAKKAFTDIGVDVNKLVPTLQNC